MPKSSYPFLSVHPANLVPLCLECNQRVKRQKDPVENHRDAPLAHCFYPYATPAIKQISVEVVRDDFEKKAGVGNIIVRIKDEGGTTISRKVKRLNYLFDLEERWATERLSHVGGEAIHSLRSGMRKRKQIEALSRAKDPDEELRDDLRELAQSYRDSFGKRVDAVVGASYLEYVPRDYKEFAIFKESLTDP